MCKLNTTVHTVKKWCTKPHKYYCTMQKYENWFLVYTALLQWQYQMKSTMIAINIHELYQFVALAPSKHGFESYKISIKYAIY